MILVEVSADPAQRGSGIIERDRSVDETKAYIKRLFEDLAARHAR